MPADEIRSVLRGQLTLARLVDLKRHWACPMQALIERAYNLVLTASQRTSLYRRAQREGMRTHEPASDQS